MNLDAAVTLTRSLLDAAVAAVDVRAAVRRSLQLSGDQLAIPPVEQTYDLTQVRRLLVLAVGKAAASMAAEAEAILGDRISGGLALTKYGHTAATAMIPVREAGHPTPDEAGLAATAELRALLTNLTADDLVLCLISGGGSALLTAPVAAVSLADLQQVTDLLLTAGASIAQLNVVRQHLEVLKGGGLAQAAAPAQTVALIISDVLGDQLEYIASGPCTATDQRFDDAWGVITAYDLAEQLPAAVRAYLQAGCRGDVPDLASSADPLWQRVHTAIVANLPLAAAAVAERAAELGWQPVAGDLAIAGEAREAVTGLLAAAEQLPADRRSCLICGGETTVTVQGAGIGGRNTELALAAALAIADQPYLAVAAVTTDGDDGPTGAAGAVAVGATVALGRAAGVDASVALANNDSATFFQQAGGLIVTGPTRTNVADLYLVFCDV